MALPPASSTVNLGAHPRRVRVDIHTMKMSGWIFQIRLSLTVSGDRSCEAGTAVYFNCEQLKATGNFQVIQRTRSSHSAFFSFFSREHLFVNFALLSSLRGVSFDVPGMVFGASAMAPPDAPGLTCLSLGRASLNP